LAYQIKEGAFDGGHGMNSGAKIVGLGAAAGICAGERPVHIVENVFYGGNPFSDDKVTGLLQNTLDFLPARNFSGTDMAGRVGQQYDISREEWRVSTAEVEQHTVGASHRYHSHAGHHR
jgi:hypothetical protein